MSAPDSQSANTLSADEPAELLAEAVEPGDFAGTVDDFLDRLHPDDRDRVVERLGANFAQGFHLGRPAPLEPAGPS